MSSLKFESGQPAAGVSAKPAALMGAMPGMMAGRRGVPLSIPLPYLLTGVLGATLFSLLIPWVMPEVLLAPGFPHVLATVHIVTLGWLTMTIMGASLQLVPVMIVAPLRATKLLAWQYPVYLIGVALLVSGFWWFHPELLAIGGTLIILAVAHHVTVLSITIAHATARPLTLRYFIASLVYLCIVVSLGLTAALDFQWHFLGSNLGSLLSTHILLGVVGWLSSMLMGVSYTLVRMFALAHKHDDRFGRIIFILLNVSIVGLATGFLCSWLPLTLLCCGLLCLTVWLFAYDYWRMFKVRHKKILDVTQFHSIAAVIYFCLAVPAGVMVQLPGWQMERVMVMLGLVALVGWLGQSIIGYLYKIVPFLVWHSRYGSLVGKQKVPLMREMVHEKLAWKGWWLFNSGLITTMIAVGSGQVVLAQACSGVLGIGIILTGINVVGVTRHLDKRYTI